MCKSDGEDAVGSHTERNGQHSSMAFGGASTTGSKGELRCIVLHDTHSERDVSYYRSNDSLPPARTTNDWLSSYDADADFVYQFLQRHKGATPEGINYRSVQFLLFSWAKSKH